MLENYSSEVTAIRNRLDADELECYLNVELMKRLDAQLQANYRNLLGR